MSLSTLLYFAPLVWHLSHFSFIFAPCIGCALSFSKSIFLPLNMRQFRFEYSLKNIPIPSRDNYLRNLIEKVESVLKRMRWKAHFFLKGEKNQENTKYFGLSSNKTPSTILELKPFEEDVLKLLENIKFRDTKNHFQENLANDLKKINSSDKIFLYMKPRSTHITSSCMTCTTSQKHINTDLRTTFRKSCNNELKHIADKLSIGNRIECMKKREAFISLKDHKENFENNPKCRLINPAKSDLGKISKLILDEVNTRLRTILNVNQWRNTQNVIEWFGNIEQKSRHSFISFDIVDFYPSISENLLDQALSWASSLADISHENISIIKHARKSLLFNNGKPWIKNNNIAICSTLPWAAMTGLKFVNW